MNQTQPNVTVTANNDWLTGANTGSTNGSSLAANTNIQKLTADAAQKPFAVDSAPVTPIQVPKPVPSPVPYTQPQNMVQGILDSVKVEDSALQKQANSISTKIASLVPELAGQSDALKTAQEAAGVNKFKQELQDLNGQIGLKMADLNRGDVALASSLQDIEDKPIAMEFITGQQASVERRAQIARASKVAEIGMFNARAVALQGNIQLATEMAKSAVEAKYQPYKEAIDLYKQQLEAIQPMLNAEEKKLSAERDLKVQFALEDYRMRKESEKTIQEYILKAAQTAPKALLESATKAKTPAEAATILGEHLGDYYNTQKLKKAFVPDQIANGNYLGAVDNYDATPEQLAQAIATQETANGTNVRPGASGELASKYQYIPATWADTSRRYNQAVNGVNSPIKFSRNIEDAVTTWQISEWKKKGYTNSQIFAMWNGGPGAANNWQNRVGVNSRGVKYDVPSYVSGASKFLAQITGMTNAVGTSATNPNTATAKSWLAQYNAGAMSLEDIYTKIGSSNDSLPIKNELARLIAEQGGKRVYGADDASIQAIQEQIKNVNKLLQNNNYGSIVGMVQGGWGIIPDGLNTGKQDMLAVAKNLVSNQTLQALAEAKSKGITFGALSESELSTLANSASNISSKIIKDKDGNVTGFSGSENTFADDLRIIKEKMEKAIANKTSSTSAVSNIVSTFENTLNNSTGSYIPKDAFVNSF